MVWVLLRSLVSGSQTDVIVNSVSQDLDLEQGAVSKAILGAAGPGLQAAVQHQLQLATASAQQRRRLVTDAFSLKCVKVFHVVCPAWDNGAGPAEQVRASRKVVETTDSWSGSVCSSVTGATRTRRSLGLGAAIHSL